MSLNDFPGFSWEIRIIDDSNGLQLSVYGLQLSVHGYQFTVEKIESEMQFLIYMRQSRSFKFMRL